MKIQDSILDTDVKTKKQYQLIKIEQNNLLI